MRNALTNPRFITSYDNAHSARMEWQKLAHYGLSGYDADVIVSCCFFSFFFLSLISMALLFCHCHIQCVLHDNFHSISFFVHSLHSVLFSFHLFLESWSTEKTPELLLSFGCVFNLGGFSAKVVATRRKNQKQRYNGLSNAINEYTILPYSRHANILNMCLARARSFAPFTSFRVCFVILEWIDWVAHRGICV